MKDVALCLEFYFHLISIYLKIGPEIYTHYTKMCQFKNDDTQDTLRGDLGPILIGFGQNLKHKSYSIIS